MLWFCHSCRVELRGIAHNPEPCCPHCQSDFIEQLEDSQPQDELLNDEMPQELLRHISAIAGLFMSGRTGASQPGQTQFLSANEIGS
jgi:hypothetical protein